MCLGTEPISVVTIIIFIYPLQMVYTWQTESTDSLSSDSPTEDYMETEANNVVYAQLKTSNEHQNLELLNGVYMHRQNSCTLTTLNSSGEFVFCEILM